jgi:hypothetical protein
VRSIALALLLLTTPAHAGTIVIDFTGESLGSHGASFVAECGCVRLSEWTGTGELIVFNFQGSRALSVGAEGGDLLLDFLVPVQAVRLEFGGDSSTDWKPAVLVGLSGGEFASIDTAAPNLNGAIDQTLQISVPPNLGPPMDQALFSFVQFGEHAPKSALVGRITLTTPEPRLIALLAVLGVVAGRRAGLAGSRRVR